MGRVRSMSRTQRSGGQGKLVATKLECLNEGSDPQSRRAGGRDTGEESGSRKLKIWGVRGAEEPGEHGLNNTF